MGIPTVNFNFLVLWCAKNIVIYIATLPPKMANKNKVLSDILIPSFLDCHLSATIKSTEKKDIIIK